MNTAKVLGVVFIVFMLVVCFNPLVDEVTGIGEHENATSHDVILYQTFPILYSVLALSMVGAGVYWIWKG